MKQQLLVCLLLAWRRTCQTRSGGCSPNRPIRRRRRHFKPAVTNSESTGTKKIKNFLLNGICSLRARLGLPTLQGLSYSVRVPVRYRTVLTGTLCVCGLS